MSAIAYQNVIKVQEGLQSLPMQENLASSPENRRKAKHLAKTLEVTISLYGNDLLNNYLGTPESRLVWTDIVGRIRQLAPEEEPIINPFVQMLKKEASFHDKTQQLTPEERAKLTTYLQPFEGHICKANAKGCLPLMEAIQIGNSEFLKLLLKCAPYEDLISDNALLECAITAESILIHDIESAVYELITACEEFGLDPKKVAVLTDFSYLSPGMRNRQFEQLIKLISSEVEVDLFPPHISSMILSIRQLIDDIKELPQISSRLYQTYLPNSPSLQDIIRVHRKLLSLPLPQDSPSTPQHQKKAAHLIKTLEVTINLYGKELLEDCLLNTQSRIMWLDIIGRLQRLAPKEATNICIFVDTLIKESSFYDKMKQLYTVEQLILTSYLKSFNGRITHTNDQGRSPLNQAIEDKNVKIIQLLLRCAQDVDLINETELHPLLLAAKNKDGDLVSLLVKYGSRLNPSDIEKLTPLEALSIQDYLNKKGALVSPEIFKKANQAFDDVCTKNHLSLKEIVDLKKTIIGCFDLNLQPLIETIKSNKANLLVPLIDLGADVNQNEKTLNIFTPLQAACRKSSPEMVQILVKAGAHINGASDVTIDRDSSPLYRMIQDNNIEMVKLLYQLGANFELVCQDFEEYNFLMFAEKIHLCSQEMIELLHKVLPSQSREYATDYWQHKSLAHMLSLQGNIKYSNYQTQHKMELEGITAAQGIGLCSDSIHDFFQSDEVSEDDVPEVMRNILKTAFSQAYPLKEPSDKEMVEMIKSGKPCVLLVGTTRHAIAIVIFKDQIIICNRGEGRDPKNADVFYNFPAKDITPEMINKLKAIHKNIDEFKKTLASLGLTKPVRGLKQKDQVVGNCTVASSNAAFFVLCVMLLGEAKGTEVYNKYLKSSRLKFLQKHLNTTSYFDVDLLHKGLLKEMKKYGYKTVIALVEKSVKTRRNELHQQMHRLIQLAIENGIAKEALKHIPNFKKQPIEKLKSLMEEFNKVILTEVLPESDLFVPLDISNQLNLIKKNFENLEEMEKLAGLARQDEETAATHEIQKSINALIAAAASEECGLDKEKVKGMTDFSNLRPRFMKEKFKKLKDIVISEIEGETLPPHISSLIITIQQQIEQNIRIHQKWVDKSASNPLRAGLLLSQTPISVSAV